MNAACPRRVSLIIALGLPTIPSPTICVLSRTVPAVAGIARRDRLRLSLADSPNLADRIEFTCLCSSRPCYGLAVLSPLLPTLPLGDAVTVRYRTALHRTETDSHRSIPSPSQAHERRSETGLNLPLVAHGFCFPTVCRNGRPKPAASRRSDHWTVRGRCLAPCDWQRQACGQCPGLNR